MRCGVRGLQKLLVEFAFSLAKSNTNPFGLLKFREMLLDKARVEPRMEVKKKGRAVSI
jgi:hypothetical protein